MTSKIALDRFTHLRHTQSGTLDPRRLPRIQPFLFATGEGGEVRYTLAGSESTDASGRRLRRVKCIISGWILLSDAESGEASRHELAIVSSLVLVRGENELPPLEQETDNEDWLVMGDELDITEVVEEEVLLDLPFWAVAVERAPGKAAKSTKSKNVTSRPAKASGGDQQKQTSAFASLAGLKTGKSPQD